MARSPGKERKVHPRSRFVIIMLLIAIVAVVGAMVVFAVFVEKPAAPNIPPTPPSLPPPVEPFEPIPQSAWKRVDEPPPEPPSTRPPSRRGRSQGSRKRSLGDADIGTGMKRLAADFNRCGREHGGVDGSVVRVGFSVSSEGRVTEAFALDPHKRTPLGRCMVSVVSRAHFGRSESGRSDIRWSITVHL